MPWQKKVIHSEFTNDLKQTGRQTVPLFLEKYFHISDNLSTEMQIRAAFEPLYSPNAIFSHCWG